MLIRWNFDGLYVWDQPGLSGLSGLSCLSRLVAWTR